METGSKGTLDAYSLSVQHLGNGAIVEKLNSGRSFFDGRARGEGSKGYVVKRDAHNIDFGSGQRTTTKRRVRDANARITGFRISWPLPFFLPAFSQRVRQGTALVADGWRSSHRDTSRCTFPTFLVNRRRSLWQLAQRPNTGPHSNHNLFVSNELQGRSMVRHVHSHKSKK